MAGVKVEGAMEDWRHQIRIYLASPDADDTAIRSILAEHGATMVSQLNAFEAYVAEAEKAGPELYPLYRWTKATLANPAARAKHAKAFALRVDGEEVYPKPVADALAAALLPLVDQGLIERVSKHDTNPAHNLPVPAEYRG